jgi:hypothetical protein
MTRTVAGWRGVSSALMTFLLIAATATTSVSCAGCPQALLVGELAQESGTLVVAGVDGAPSERIIWPFGYGVREDGEKLVLTDLFGAVKAREGNVVRLGGGETESGTFKVCGQLEVDPA